MELLNLDFEFYLDYALKEHKSENDNLFFFSNSSYFRR